jgi:hypothetical protein
VSCPYLYDDGAYILGALSPAERADYERHLPSCAQCRESVSALAGLPGLLGRLDPSTAVPSVAAAPTLLPRLLAAAAGRRRTDRRRRLWRSVAVTATAAILAVAVGVGVHLADQSPATTEVTMTAMLPVNPKIPIDAEIGLSPAEGGTWVSMRCRYDEGYPGAWQVRLVVFPQSGASEQVGSWMAEAGREVTLTALSHFDPNDIARVELQRADYTTLLWWTPT